MIADICRDLGIKPGDVEPALWYELQRAMTQYGGNLDKYLIDMNRRSFRPLPGAAAPVSRSPCGPPAAGLETPRSSPPEPPEPPALATGPPLKLPIAA